MNRRLETIIDKAEDWESYAERHGDHHQWSVEVALEIVRSLLAWNREEDR